MPRKSKKKQKPRYPQRSFHVRGGDEVMIIAGNHKGKSGKILKVNRKKLRVTVEGVNMVKKHMKPTQENPEGGITEKEGTVHISNVMKMDEYEKRLKKSEERVKKAS